MPIPDRTHRRDFLQRSAALSAGALAIPYFVPGSALGLAGAVAASDRIVFGSIGTGGQGRGLLNGWLGMDDLQVVAVCDVDTSHRNAAMEQVNMKYGNKDCATFHDFRELLARKDIDAVCVATPDHWHALASVAAANAGKDIYCEKPLSNSIGEGRAIANAVKKNNRILQTGSHERSGDNSRFACELVRNGRIGKLHTVRINLPCSDGHHKKAQLLREIPAARPIPSGFDFDTWMGHTAAAPYSEQRCHFWWRFILAYGGGEMTDRGAHVIDIAQLGMNADDTGPVEIKAMGVVTPGSLYNTYWDYAFENVYANGVRVIGSSQGPRGLKFEGSDGWIFIKIHGGALEAEPASLLKEIIGEKEVHLGRSPGHQRNFIDCVKSREQPVAHAEAGHRTASVCHINNIAMKLARPLKWDPVKEQFLNDAEANALIMPKLRSPWTL
ncbi:MAG: Gfo/Idh/MocA family oxidoreductase [Planctomycetota bacterium]|nr:Gfo/Idh/MocA family oxidoreductase [Planctomycetota bacterium]MDA1180350.1 Gfo/Idh/MocA family oxidoreductase [Planctomycetota bacterium]